MRNRNTIQMLSPREKAEHNYKSSRANLLVVVIFTLVNIVMAMLAEGTYFLFTAFIPYILVFTGMMICGKLPAEFYEGLEEMEFLPPAVLYVMLVIALIIVGIYFLCWLLSKKHYAFMIVAFILFLVDTLFLVVNFDLSMIVDLVFHIWVLYYLGSGMFNGIKLKKMPPEPDSDAPIVYENGVPINNEQTDSDFGYTDGFTEAPAEENKSDEENKGDTEGQ